MPTLFEWDRQKAETNLRKHGVSFEEAQIVDDEMRPEYDFTGGVRGKRHKVLREEGYTVRVYNNDGTVTGRHVAGERMVMLEPDMYEYFSDS